MKILPHHYQNDDRYSTSTSMQSDNGNGDSMLLMN